MGTPLSFFWQIWKTRTRCPIQNIQMGIPITSFLKKKIMAYWNKCAICTFTSCPVSQREFLSKSWPFLPYYLMSSPLFCSSSEQHAPRCAIFKKRGSFYCRPSAASCDNVKKVHPKWRRWACISFERDLFIRKGDFMQWPCFVTIWVVNAHYTFCLEQYILLCEEDISACFTNVMLYVL